MLREIHIQNYAVIDNLAVEFAPGLNLLSGETGSGKSILVDALGLALGGRASAEVIRTGQDRALVTAVFSVEGRVPWSNWLEEFGVAPSEEADLILRREIQAGGKSRMLVNDQPVTLAAVRSLARGLVEMHGQNEHVALFAREAQLGLLDQFAELEADLEQVRSLHARRRELEQELDSLSHDEQERLRTIDLLAFQVRELEQARLEPGEDVRLGEERRILSNLEKVRAAAASAFAELYEDEGAALSRLAAAARQIEELRHYDSAVEPQLEPLAGARATLEDLASFLRDYLGKLEANPQRLEEIEDRLALLDRLKRKYGNSIEAVRLMPSRRVSGWMASNTPMSGGKWCGRNSKRPPATIARRPRRFPQSGGRRRTNWSNWCARNWCNWGWKKPAWKCFFRAPRMARAARRESMKLSFVSPPILAKSCARWKRSPRAARSRA